MTTPCLRLDDYLDGRLSDADAEAFETHTLDCSTCDASLEAAAPDLSPLRDVTCPPAVLDAALRSARRAPDREPAIRHRSRRRFVVAPLALLAALAVAVGVSEWVAPDGPGEPASAPVAAVPELDVPDEPPSSAAPSDGEPGAVVAPSDPTPAPDVAAPAPPPPAPPEAAPSPIPDVAPPSAEPPDEAIAQMSTPPDSDPLSATDEPTPEEIEAAREDIALAFHLVAEAQSQARAAVRAEAGPVSSSIGRALPF